MLKIPRKRDFLLLMKFQDRRKYATFLSNMIDIKMIKPQDLWYVVGYIATDGCLSKDGRHIDITSKDRQILEEIQKALYLKIGITRKYNSTGQPFLRLQFSDVKFYKFLISINLTPKKSLTLGKLKIPDEYFPDFFRGVIDGDGSITSWEHPINCRQQWALRVVSASKDFIEWLQQEAESYYKIIGKRYTYLRQRNRNELYLLKFGKIATKIIIEKCYYENCLSLQRKYKQAILCLESQNGWRKYHGMICPGAETGIQSGLKIQ